MKYLVFIFCLFLFSCNKEKATTAIKNSENHFYEEAWRNLDAQKKDSAFYYFNKSKNTFFKANDSLGVAKCLMNMAIMQRDYGDFIGSQETAVNALKILDQIQDTIYISTVLNNLGTNEMELGNHEQSILYLNKAISKTKNITEKNFIRNNKAIAFSKLNFNDSCFIILKDLIVNNKKNNSQYIDNYEYLKWKKNPDYNAEPQLFEALKIRQKEKDFLGQNASQAHISDYYEHKNPAKSLFHAHKMYEIAKKIKNPEDQLEALEKLVNLEDHSKSASYFKRYLKLNDSLETARNKAKNQFALIQYESEKNRGDFLKATADNITKNYQLLLRNIALIIAFSILILGVFLYRKRQKDLIQEKKLEVKETALKYSKKVHDVVSNGIYQVMSEIENSSNIDKNDVLNKLENVYEKSRDISYENFTGNPDVDQKLQVSNLLNSFRSDLIKPILIGNEEMLWAKISPKLKAEILIILQELLVNMKKHSQAQKVILKFEITLNQLYIFYSDDGIGLEKDFQKKNGLKNIEKRIFSHGGTVKFEQLTAKGLKINIAFPIKFK